jgi:hypothetical protein
MENKELLSYRSQLIQRLGSTAKEFSETCLAVSDPYVPVEVDGWNAHQLAAHARDVQIHVYGARVRRTVNEEKPEFPNFDGDAWNLEHYHADEPVGKIVKEFLEDVREITSWLEELPLSAWSRLSRHEVYGEFAMQTWVERMLAHIEEHLATLKKAV